MLLSVARKSLVHVCRLGLVQQFRDTEKFTRLLSSLNNNILNNMSLKYKTVEKGASNSTDYRIFFRKCNIK